MTSVLDLLRANLHRVFNNRDADSRRAAIDETYTSDVTLTDPEGVTIGQNALDAKAGGLLASLPAEFQFAEDSIPYLGEDAGALAWVLGPVGSPAARGLDIITVRDGRIASIRTFVVPVQS